MLFERMNEQAKTAQKRAKQYEEEMARKLKRGRYVAYGFLFSAFGGIIAAIAAKGVKDSEDAPSMAFYAYKRKLMTGNDEEDSTSLRSSRSTMYDDMTYSEMLANDQCIDWKKFGTSAVAGGALSYLFFRAVFSRRLITCPPNKYLIIYKKHRGHDFDNGIFNDMLEPGQVQFVRPIIDGYGFLNAENVPIQFNRFKAETKDKTPVFIDLDMNIGVGELATEVCFASAKHLNKDVPQLQKQAKEILEKAIQDNLKDFEYSEIENNSEDFYIYLQQLIAWYMKYLGLNVRDCSLLAYESGTVKLGRKNLKRPGEVEEEP